MTYSNCPRCSRISDKEIENIGTPIAGSPYDCERCTYITDEEAMS